MQKMPQLNQTFVTSSPVYHNGLMHPSFVSLQLVGQEMVLFHASRLEVQLLSKLARMKLLY